jgi:voltage-dependent potassium channel beta subunit
MEYRRLGKSGLPVSVLSLGSWVTFGNQINDSIAQSCMEIAYNHGVNFFDNAEIYASGKSELVMGRILKKLNWDRSSYIVSSKVFFGNGGKLPTQIGLHRKHVLEACNAALKRLQLDYLDLYFCHRPDKNTPIEETVWTMNQLIAQGKVLYWGTSEWSAQEITEAHLVAQRYNLLGPTMEQPQYNMFHRTRFEVEYNRLYQNYGLGTTIWSPLASGTLTDKYANQIPSDTRLDLPELKWLREQSLTDDKLHKIKSLSLLAAELGTSLAKLAIAWTIKNPNVTTAILGASKPSQLEETLTALDVLPLLTESIMEQIETILQNKPAQPRF